MKKHKWLIIIIFAGLLFIMSIGHLFWLQAEHLELARYDIKHRTFYSDKIDISFYSIMCRIFSWDIKDFILSDEEYQEKVDKREKERLERNRRIEEIFKANK